MQLTKSRPRRFDQSSSRIFDGQPDSTPATKAIHAQRIGVEAAGGDGCALRNGCSVIHQRTVVAGARKELTDEDLARFVTASIPSVWALECLLLMKRLAPAAQTRTEIVIALRSSELAIAQGLTRLENAGLISEHDGHYRYSPATLLLGELTDRLEHVYTRRPIWLMNVVLRAKHDSLQVFADSFRLKE